jgi:AcrR family transcriptional regulator
MSSPPDTTATPHTKPAPRRYQGVSAEERLRARKERLVLAATEVFGRLGFKSATMRDICHEARLADRYFYESFKNVDDAFEAVYAQMADELIAAIGLAMSQSPSSVEDLVQNGLRAFFTFIQADPRRAQVMLIDAVHAGQYSARDSTGRGPVYNRVIGLMSGMLEQRAFGTINGRLVASGLVGIAIHTATTWAQDGFKVSVDVVLEHNLYAWRGLKLWAEDVRQAQATTAQAAQPPDPAELVNHVLTSFKPDA